MSIKVKKKLGERIVKISDELNIPRITVERVIRSYLDGLVESAQEGETIVIDNIMSIKLVENKVTGEIRLRGRVSPALKSKIYLKNKPEMLDINDIDESEEEEEVIDDNVFEN